MPSPIGRAGRGLDLWPVVTAAGCLGTGTNSIYSDFLDSSLSLESLDFSTILSLGPAAAEVYC